jgi:hypothetical protein
MGHEPGVSLTPPVPDSVLQIRLGALCTVSWAEFEGEPVEVRGNGTFTVTVPVGAGVTQLGVLNISHIGNIATRFHNGTISVDTVTINSNTIGHTHASGSGLTVLNDDNVRVVDTVLWNNWWENGQILTTGVTPVAGVDNGRNFALAGGGVINTVTITFTVGGVANCSDCSAAVCTCGPPEPPARNGMQRSAASRVCAECGVEKHWRTTNVWADGAIVSARERTSAKRDSSGALIVNGCRAV